MASDKPDLRSLPFHEILAAPLIAATEAQLQSSLRILEVVQEVGFEEGDGQEKPVARTVEFRYERQGLDAEGRPVRRETRLRVPVLALLSLSQLEVEKLEIRCRLRLRSVERQAPSPRLRIDDRLRRKYGFLEGAAGLRVAPVAKRITRGGEQTSQSFDLDVTLTARSEDVTEGLDRVLTALGAVVSEETE